MKFSDSVYLVVGKIPRGKVASYGQIALYVGMPRAARQVGWILNKLSDISVPWWRVVNNQGRISIKGSQFSAEEQRQLLVREGIDVGGDFTFDIEKYRWKPDEKTINKFQLDFGYLDSIAGKIEFSKQR